jgi:translocation and assembly module TamB
MRRALKVGAWTIGSLLLLGVLFVAAVLVVANTARGRALIERATAQLTNGRVRVTGLAGSLPATIDLEQLQLSDADGTWLTATHISLRWSPLALWERRVDVESLRLVRLDIERLPVGESAQANASSTRVPRVDLRQLSIGMLTLGPQLAGAPVSLSVQGSAHLNSLQDANAILVARRADGQGDYELALGFDPARMDATVKIEEPADGPLQNLLRFPGLGALSVLASMNGPRGAERIQLTARAGDLHAQVEGALDLTRESADLDYSLEAPAMSPRSGLSWQHIALQGRWHGTVSAPQADGRLQIKAMQIPGGAALAALDADLHADRGSLAVRAIADGLVLPGPRPRLLVGSPLQVNATVQLDDAARPLQLGVEHRLFSLQAHAITAGTQGATFKVHIPDVAPLAAIAGESLRGKCDLAGTLRYSPATTRLDLDANTDLAEGTTPSSRLLAGASRLELGATLTDRNIELDRLTLDASALSVSGSGGGELGAASAVPALKSLHGRYGIDLKNLALLSPTLAGSLKLDGEVEGPIDSLATRFQMTSTLSIRGSPRETILASVKARGLPSHLSATLQAQGHFAGAPLQVDSTLEQLAANHFHVVVQRAQWKSARLEGDLTTADNKVAGNGSLRLRVDRMADLEPLLGTRLLGSLDGDLTLRPIEGNTDVQLRVAAQNVIVGGFAVNTLLTASGPIDALSLRLAAHSPSVGGEPVSLDADARLDLGTRELSLQHAQAHYHGQLLRLLSPAQIRLSEEIEIRDLKLVAQRAIVEVNGQVVPVLDLRASVRGVDASLVNAFVPDLLAHGTLQADAVLRGTLSTPTGLVTLTATGLRLADSSARDLAAVDVHATARLSAGVGQLDARVDAGATSRLLISGTVPLGDSGALDLKLSGELDAAFAPKLLSHGSLVADGALRGTFSAPSGRVTVKASGLRLANSAARDLASVDGIASVDFTPDLAQIDAQLTGGAASRLRLSGTAPLGTAGALNLKIDGKFDAALANPWLAARGERVAGTVNVEGTVTGTARSSAIDGTIGLTHGDLRDDVQGLHLSDIAAQLVADHGVLTIASLTARAPPGQLSMTGTIGVLQPKIPVSLQLHAQNAQLISGDLLTSSLGADLKLEGTLREAVELSGTINLNRTVIGIPNGLPPEVAVLDVRRPGQTPPAPAERELIIGLDLALHAPRQIIVQGRGLNAELGGDLHIAGTTAIPQVSGGFELIRGTLSLSSSQLTNLKGTVSFDGDGLKHRIDPTLDFSAQSADGTATLRLTGHADAPQFTLSSVPPLPQDEILARLLFGESASQLTALQVAQIGVALTTLSGATGEGFNPIARVQRALGLDQLSVGGASNATAAGPQSPGANVQAGRYISSRVFVGAKRSTSGVSQALVDVDLSKHLKLQTRVGNGTATTQGTTPDNDPGSSVGIRYQFEY